MQDAENYEQALLSALRLQYESRGYSFFSHPTSDIVPPFLGSYRPDAIAISPKESVVVEVKAKRAPEHQSRLTQIAKLVESQQGWKFKVYYGSASEPRLYDRPTVENVENQFKEAKELASQGHMRAAFVLGWAALEAAARALSSDSGKIRVMMPRELVNWLTQEGFIRSAERKVLRNLTQVRNAIVHGALEQRVDKSLWTELEKALTGLIKTLRSKGSP